MRKLTPRANAIRMQTAGWLGPLMRTECIRDSDLAIEMLAPERREELSLQGARTLIQDAPRKKIAGWRLGKRTPDADSAFDLGEALRRRSIRGVCGASVAFKLGYSVDLARALLNLSAMQGDRLSTIALFVAVPLAERESTIEESELFQPAQNLLDAAILAAGPRYEASWKARYFTRSRWVPLLNTIDNLARDTTNLNESALLVWRLLIEWAVLLAPNLGTDGSAPEESIELALLSLTLNRIADSVFELAESHLAAKLLGLLQKRKENHP